MWLTLLIGIEYGADGSSGYRGRIRAALNFLNDGMKHSGMFNDPLDRAQFELRGPDHRQQKLDRFSRLSLAILRLATDNALAFDGG